MSTSTRERLIRAAHDHFYASGFHGVGLDRIIEEVGVTKTTFYNHFESKDDLVVAVLQQHDSWWREEFRRMLREHGGDSPRAQLLAIFDALEGVFAGEDFKGCIFINVAVEYPSHNDPVHAAALRHMHAMEGIIRHLAAAAGADDPAALAKEIGLIMQGAYVTRQIEGPSAGRALSEVGRGLLRAAVERRTPHRGAPALSAPRTAPAPARSAAPAGGASAGTRG